MTTITVRKLNPEVHDQIRIYAAKHGRSVEAEVRNILAAYVRQHELSPKDIAKRIHKRFAKIGHVDDLPSPKKQAVPDPITFDE